MYDNDYKLTVGCSLIGGGALDDDSMTYSVLKVETNSTLVNQFKINLNLFFTRSISAGM